MGGVGGCLDLAYTSISVSKVGQVLVELMLETNTRQ